MNDSATPLTVGQCATLACLIEATVPKPGFAEFGPDWPKPETLVSTSPGFSAARAS